MVKASGAFAFRGGTADSRTQQRSSAPSMSGSARPGLNERLLHSVNNGINGGSAAAASASAVVDVAAITSSTVKPLDAAPLLVVNQSSPTSSSSSSAAAAATAAAAVGKAGSTGIVFTLWNTMMGSTLLVMPYTFHAAGWLLSLGLSVVSGVLAQHTCGLVLFHAESLMADESAEFADFAELHLGRFAKWLTFLSGNVVVLGAAAAMHIYMRTVLEHLVGYPPAHGGFCYAANASMAWPPRSPTVCEAALGGDERLFYSCVVLTVVLPLANLPSIKWLSKLTTVGCLCFLLIIGFALASAAVSASTYGLVEQVLRPHEMAKPEDASVVFGIFSLSFFIHNAVLTIMRGAAEPQHNSRDLSVAFVLVWFCYAVMGVSANVFPPLGDLDAVGSPLSQNGLIALQQPEAMAPFLVLTRLAVLVQSLSVYPVLLFIVRSQLFTAVYYRRPYPGPLPVALLSCGMAATTTAVSAMGVSISVVLKFVGAAGGLVCVFTIPALVHGRIHWRRCTLTLPRVLQVGGLVAFGLYVFVIRLV